MVKNILTIIEFERNFRLFSRDIFLLTRMSYWHIISAMQKMKPRKLRVPTPLYYARALDFDPSNLCHIKACRRRIVKIPEKAIKRVILLLEAAREDDRLKGLKLLDLIPGLEKLLPYIP